MERLDDHETAMVQAMCAEKAESLFDHAQRCQSDKEHAKWAKEAQFWQDISDKLRQHHG